MKQYLKTLILSIFIIAILYCSIIVIYPVSFKYKYLFVIAWVYLLVALKAYITREPNEKTFLMKFPDILLVTVISTFSIMLALIVLIIIVNKHSIFYDFEELVKLFTKDNINIIANSTFLSIITLFFLAYNFYKTIYNKAYLRIANKMKMEINYHNLFPYFTVLITFFGFLPLFIIKFVDSDEVLDKIESVVLFLFMVFLVPYIHLIFEKAEKN